MASTTLRMLIVGEDRASRAFKSAGRSAAEASGQIGGFGKVAKGVFAGIGGWFALSGVTEGVKKLVDVGSEYTQELARIQALSGANNAMMGVTEHKLESSSGLYAKYGSTVADAASGVVALVKAGQTLPNSLKEVNATLVLAKSGMLSVSDASEIVSNSINTFHLRAQDASDIANKFANAADASAADVSTLAEALKYVGPVAHASNIPLNQTLAVLAELSNAGIDASNSGTGFRKFIASLQAPTGKSAKVINDLGVQIYDASGKMKPLGTIIDDIRKKMSGLSDQNQKADLRQVFGLTGIASANVILDNGAKGLEKYTKAVDRAGGASRLAMANSAGLSGILREIRADAISTAQAFYRKYSPMVASALRSAFAWVQTNGPKIKAWASTTFAAWEPALRSVGQLVKDTFASLSGSGGGGVLATFTSALKAAAGIVNDLAKALDAIPQPVKKFAVEVAGAALAMSLLNKSVTFFKGTALVAGVRSMTAGLAGMRTELTMIGTDMRWRQAMNTLSSQGIVNTSRLNMSIGALSTLRTKLVSLGPAATQAAGIGGMLLLGNSMTTTSTKAKVLEGTLGGALAGFAAGGPLGAAVGTGIGLFSSLASAANTTTDAALQMQEQIQHTRYVQAQKAADDAIIASLNGVTGAYTGATRAAVLQKLQTSGMIQYAQALKIPTGQLISAVLGEGNARALVTKRISAQREEQLKLNTNTEGEFKRNGKLITSMDALRQLFPQVTSKTLADRAAKQKNLIATEGLRKVLGETAKQYAAMPKSVKTDLQLKGLPQSRGQLDAFVRKYGRGSIGTALLIAKLNGISTTRAQLAGLVRAARSAGTDGGHALSSAFAAAASSGNPSAIGAALAAGVAAGIHSSAFLVTRQAVAMVASAEQAARARGIIKSPSRLMRDRVGKPLAEGVAVGIRKGSAEAIKEAGRLVEHVGRAGETLMNNLLKGLQSKEVPLKTMLARLTNYIQSQQQKLASDVSNRNQFAQGFSQFSSSIFGADYGTDANGNPVAPTVGGILAYQQKQASDARSLNRNVRKLLKMGLSKSLIQQMEAAGPSGIAEINALANGASASQIKTLNQANAATYRYDHLAGMAAGNAIYGQQIAQDRANIKLAKAIAGELAKEQSKAGKHEELVGRVSGNDIIISIRKTQRAHGKKPTV